MQLTSESSKEREVRCCRENLVLRHLPLSPGSEGLDKWTDHQDEINLLLTGDPILRFKLVSAF